MRGHMRRKPCERVRVRGRGSFSFAEEDPAPCTFAHKRDFRLDGAARAEGSQWRITEFLSAMFYDITRHHSDITSPRSRFYSTPRPPGLHLGVEHSLKGGRRANRQHAAPCLTLEISRRPPPQQGRRN